jgi:hypothetical protein
MIEASKDVPSQAEFRQKALLTAYECAHSEIIAMQKKADAVVTIGLALSTAALTFGVNQEIKDIFLFVPFAAFSLLLYMIFMYTIVLSLGGYKKYLEERINIEIGSSILSWEREVGSRIHNSIGAWILWCFLGVVPIIVTYYSIKQVLQVESGETVVVVVILLSLLSFGTAAALLRLALAFDSAYQVATNNFEKNTP